MSNPPRTPFPWNRHVCAGNPFNLSATVASGQSFRWRRDAEGIWWGVIEQTVAAAWQAEGEPDSPLYWQTFPEHDRWDLPADYFRLSVDLEALYADWSRAEPRIAPSLAAYRGLRILRQPPEECFFAFQCAACNTVTKITRSVTSLAERYGRPISFHSPSAQPSHSPIPEHRNVYPAHPFAFYAFPTLEALANADEAVLRAGLWGYRAPRVIANAQELLRRPPGWLASLRRLPYREAHAELVGLFGIGAKIADCICLFALDKDQAAPVDTHIRQIAVRLFAPELAGKSLTPRIYDQLADAFRARFGPYTGWAQQYLFFEALTSR